MHARRGKLSRNEIAQPFEGTSGDMFPPFLSPEQLAHLLGISRKTIYEWIARGRLDGAFRKRGKHVLFWRDRAIHIIFNGPDWSSQ